MGNELFSKCFAAKKAFIESINTNGELSVLLGKDKSGSTDADIFKHRNDIRIKWTLPKGVDIRACFRPYVGKSPFGERSVIIFCQLSAVNGEELYLAYVKNVNCSDWYKLTRLYSDNFNDIDKENTIWSYGKEKIDTSLLLAWVKSCDVIFERDFAREIEDCGNLILGADSRKNQTPYINNLQNIINDALFRFDPVIKYWLDKFLGEVPKSTPRSTDSVLSHSRAIGHLMNFVGEVRDKKWQTESKEAREEKYVQLFRSE